MTPTIQLLSTLGAIIASAIFATWVLSNKISATRSDIMEKISKLDTDLAVLKNSEAARDEKINKMWTWWLKALEEGWTKHMKGLTD